MRSSARLGLCVEYWLCAAHTALEERQLVINHFNNGKSQIEITEIIKGSHSVFQHIVERHKKEDSRTGKVRMIAKKSFTA